jgi:hypothetical protein
MSPNSLSIWLAAAAVVLVAACGAAKPREPAVAPTPTGGRATPLPAHGSICERVGEEYQAGNRTCVCAGPCSGAEPEVPPPDTWSCQDRDPACPSSPPTAGTPCPRRGLSCFWGNCGGVSAHCPGDGTWHVEEAEPPP